MRRIAVVGCPGSGKTTLARRLAGGLGVPHIEFDHLHWREGWVEAPAEEFATLLREALDAASDGWVTDGNYRTRSRGMHLAAADTVAWIDLPRRTVVRRVVWRTLRRAVTRERLFGRDMVEPLTNLTRWREGDNNIIRWAWVHHPLYVDRYETAIAHGEWDHLVVHRLRSPAAVAAFARHAVAGGVA